MKDHDKEINNHNLGCFTMVAGIVLLLMACGMNGGTIAGVVGGIGIVLVIIGFFPWSSNRSASKIKEDEKLAKAMVSLWGTKVQTGHNLTGKDVDNAMSVMGLDAVEKHNQAKKDAAKIVKGAVVGGIVAGETGAVVGAAMAKNKIDNEKNNK